MLKTKPGAKAMQLKKKLLIVVSLVGFLLVGCTSTKIVTKTIKPTCTPAHNPIDDLQLVTVNELKNVSDKTYNKLVSNEVTLQAWGIANEKIIKRICSKPKI